MTDESDEPSPPDEVRYSEPLSRRALLAAGATAAATGTAGCADAARDVGEDLGVVEEEVWTEEGYKRTRTQLETVKGYELEIGEATLDSVQFTLDNYLNSHQRPEEAVEGTLRIYGKTPIGDDGVVLGENGASFRGGGKQEHEVSLEFGEDLMNVPRELEVRFASPQLDTSEVVVDRSDVVYLPFDNVARDERTLRELGSAYMSEGTWNDERGEKQKAEIWYNELDEPSFNMPALDNSAYDYQTYEGEDWFDLYDFHMTAIIRVPMLDRDFAVNDEGVTQGPYYDWTVVNLELTALEYLESLLYNSPSTMKLLNPHEDWSVGRGRAGEKEVQGKKDYASSMLIAVDDYDEGAMFSPREVDRVAQDAAPAVDAFFRGSLHEVFGFDEPFDPLELRTGNPLKFSVGRTFTRRWGEEFSDAVVDKPYADTFESEEYQKMTTLKAFVGDLQYQFTVSAYQQTPEETMVNKFLRDAKGQNPQGSDCVTSTMLFIGIAHWMTGKHPLMIRTDVSEGLDHIFAGFHDLELLTTLQNIGYPNIASYEGPENEPRPSDEAGYTYTDVECTEPYPSIGFHRFTTDNTSRRTVAWSNLEDLNTTSHIPVNDDWEPDVDGEIRAIEEGAFRGFFVNPFDFEYIFHFEDERNR